jgi:group II intron reverse transcriptase/maturase
MPEKGLTSLNQHLDLTWLREAYRRTRKDGAAGIDGQTAADYEQDLEGNLRSLLERAKSGTYWAPPVRRVHIPKGTEGATRPIGIPTLEDKVLQRAVAMLLEPIYEHDFYDCSYGFRPRRSAHDTLDHLSKQTMWSGVSCILDVDISKFFDTLDHAHLRTFLQQRIRDGVVLRLIGKWLNAGVMEDGAVTHPEAGSPQGGVISPLLANVYLHYVLDEWFAREVRPRLRGRAYMVRYADDFVIGFTDDEDSRRVKAVLPKRFGKYGLTIHPDKTRLVPFRKPEGERNPPTTGGLGTFDFLGFTHFWARSRKGTWVLKRKTAASRFTRAVRTISQWCRQHRHDPIDEQHKMLCQKMRGHAGYYGIVGNSPALSRFYHEVLRIWRKWLMRRRRAWRVSWDWFRRLLTRYPVPYLRTIRTESCGVANDNLRNRMR